MTAIDEKAMEAALLTADETRNAALREDVNDALGALNMAVRAAILAYKAAERKQEIPVTAIDKKAPTRPDPLFVQEGHASPWRPWFAWHPVWIRDDRWPYAWQKRVWLVTVLRRKFHAAPWFLDGCTWWWQYAAMPLAPTPFSPDKG